MDSTRFHAFATRFAASLTRRRSLATLLLFGLGAILRR